jgi:hypothetical protein
MFSIRAGSGPGFYYICKPKAQARVILDFGQILQA